MMKVLKCYFSSLLLNLFTYLDYKIINDTKTTNLSKEGVKWNLKFELDIYGTYKMNSNKTRLFIAKRNNHNSRWPFGKL